MNIKNIKLTFTQISGGSKSGILTAVRPNPEYIEGKASGRQLGFKYEVVLPENSYEKVVVKVEKNNVSITPEYFDELNAEGKVWVSFSNDFEAKLYKDNNGNIAITAKADNIQIEEGDD